MRFAGAPLVRIVALVLALTVLPRGFAQGITTSAMTGVITDKQGQPVAGATVTALHEPSGTRSTAISRANGQYNLSGLRIGGPYTITVAPTKGLSTEPVKELYLALDQRQEINFELSSEVVKLEAFRVSENADTTFGSGRMGTGSNFTEKQIEGIASVRSNVQDVARLDSRLTLNSLDQGGQLSAQGQNFRFNSFLVDGVESNDPFGLNSNGFGSLRSPVAMNSIQALTVELNPFDVRRSGFTGALINAVTKSGTNEFHGTGSYDYTGKSMRAKNPNPASSLFGQKESFKERAFNFGIGGPIIKDKLFFYLNYDDFRREATAPATSFTYTDKTQIDAIVAQAKAVGYDVGELNSSASNITTQKTTLGKIDWNISDQQRLSLSYRRVDGTSPTFPGYTSVFGQSFSNYWYAVPRLNENYTAQLFSQWTPDFRTEASVTYVTYDGSPKNAGKAFPAVTINGLTGIRGDTGATIATGSVLFGTEFSRQLNVLKTKETLGKLVGEYSLGNHTLAVGAESDQLKYYNAFAQGINGSYTFANVAAWQSGTPSAYTLAKPFAGYTINDAIANWKYQAYAGLIQDTWKPTSRLTVLAGIRLDYPYVPEKPAYNAAFTTAFGMRNDTNNSGNYTIAPRVGFNYQLKTSRPTEIRGGVGLFQGRNPAVWLSNAYSQAGTLGTVSVSNPGAGFFVADPTKQPLPAGSPPIPNINVTDPNFKQPVIWKGNIAVDHQLPFLGLTFSAEYNATRTEKALAIEFLNYQTATDGGPLTTPDGRIRYAGNITPNYATNATPNNTTTFAQTNANGRRRVAGFADVFRLTNTNEGQSHGVTIGLNRPLKNNWATGISWTRGNATEVSPMTSSTAGSLYNTRAVYNPNDNKASVSNTNTKDKIVASVTRQFEFIKNYKTNVSLIYVGQTGHNYSWVFKGDANGDGFTDNDLFYMPNGTNDTKVRWNSTTERDAFFAFATANGLDKYKGQVLGRNEAVSPFANTIDLSITQDIPIYKQVKTQLFLNVVNFANLFNKSWGLQEEVPFSYKRTIAGAYYDRTANGGAGQYGYVFNQNTFATVPTVADDTQASRWQIKLGVKVSF
jgi:hypothetical protein